LNWGTKTTAWAAAFEEISLKTGKALNMISRGKGFTSSSGIESPCDARALLLLLCYYRGLATTTMKRGKKGKNKKNEES